MQPRPPAYVADLASARSAILSSHVVTFGNDDLRLRTGTVDLGLPSSLRLSNAAVPWPDHPWVHGREEMFYMFNGVDDLGNPEHPAAVVFVDAVLLPDACNDSEALHVHMHALFFLLFCNIIFLHVRCK